ncbi:hypothetical protein GCM10010276_31700 [Streptomyces longisporus]|uniref:Lipoprotein n=1 Tax=Streptomyces longisporus TaxID=1948 RepID=A0ABN3LWB5_STRLO
MRAYICRAALILAVVSAWAGCGAFGKGPPTPVATGPVTMPDLVGKNAEQAEDQREKLGVPKGRSSCGRMTGTMWWCWWHRTGM